jgi:diguanylate cyclase (GGDEF)-like protein
MIEVEVNSAYRRSIKETLLLLLSGILAVSVTLLAYLRLLDSQWTLASVDMGFVGIMLLLFLFVYVSRKTRTAGILIALGFISAALTSTLLLGPSEIFWAFPALMVAYFMLDARQATILTGGFVGCFLAIVWDDLSAVALTKICLTLVITVLLANAFSLTNRRQLEDLRRKVNVDPLTGAGNRRAQNLKLDSVAAIFRRNESPATLLILDIDHFKRINDTYGHIVGDQILIELNELVCRNTRATESLYRYGGKEFVLVAEQTALDDAVELAKKVRSLIEQHRFTGGIQVTVSIGVAQLQRKEDAEGWLSRADAALYQAKGRGRNQVIAAGGETSLTMVHMSTMHHSDEPGARPAVLSRSM